MKGVFRRRTISVILVAGLILALIISANSTSAAANAAGTAGYETTLPSTDLAAPSGSEDAMLDQVDIRIGDMLRQLLQLFADYLASQPG